MSKYKIDRDAVHAHDPLVQRAQRGIEAETFLESNIGRFLIAKSEREIETNYQLLAAADPFDPAAVGHLQNKIEVARVAIQWLVEAVNEGYAAEHVIREQESYE